MANIPYMKSSRNKAALIYQSKVHLIHKKTEEVAIAEIKIWEIPVSHYFPEGIKYSLFLVWKDKGEVILGFDNHKPKGPHIHRDDVEILHIFKGADALVEEFWQLVIEEGFEI